VPIFQCSAWNNRRILALCSEEIMVFALISGVYKKPSPATTELTDGEAVRGTKSPQQGQENAVRPVGRTYAAGWWHEQICVGTMIRHFILVGELLAGGLTFSIIVLAAAVSEAPAQSILVSLVGRAALPETRGSAATVATIDLPAITRRAANEHRAAVRCATKAQEQKNLRAGLHRSRGGTRQPKSSAGKIQPYWDWRAPAMGLPFDNPGCWLQPGLFSLPASDQINIKRENWKRLRR
jgi:hypothetical protein